MKHTWGSLSMTTMPNMIMARKRAVHRIEFVPALSKVLLHDPRGLFLAAETGNIAIGTEFLISSLQRGRTLPTRLYCGKSAITTSNVSMSEVSGGEFELITSDEKVVARADLWAIGESHVPGRG